MEPEIVTGEVVENVVEEAHLFMTTPFYEYTVTEGLLLFLCIFFIISGVFRFIRWWF